LILPCEYCSSISFVTVLLERSMYCICLSGSSQCNLEQYFWCMSECSKIRCWDLKRSLTIESFEIVWSWSKWYVFNASFKSHACYKKMAVTHIVRVQWYVCHRRNWTFLPKDEGFTPVKIPPTYIGSTSRGPIRRAYTPSYSHWALMSILTFTYQFYEFTTKFWLGRWHDEKVGIFAWSYLGPLYFLPTRGRERHWGFPVLLLGELNTFSSNFT
jgi:hypothetical protein